MNNREKMGAGKLFTDMDCGLPEERLQAKKYMKEFRETGLMKSQKELN